MAPDTWASGDAYEPYIGRWSRPVAREFLRWLNVPRRQQWLDVGCGTGALSQTILAVADPASVRGVDRSPEYVAYANAHVRDPRATFAAADATDLPDETASIDAAVSGLVLNFVPEPAAMLGEMVRVLRPGGTAAVYVWDYADDMQLIRCFWDAAVALDPAAEPLDEGKRFPVCHPELLRNLFEEAGLRDVETRPIDVPTRFHDFDDYWTPFLGGQGPAPGYTMSLSESARAALRERLRATLPTAADGSITLTARAWAARGTRS